MAYKLSENVGTLYNKECFMRNVIWMGGLLVILAVIRILAQVMIPVPIDIKDATDLILTASFFGVAMLLLGGYTVAAFKVAFDKH